MYNNQKELLDNLNDNSTLNEIQDYIKKVIDMRGFNDETPSKLMLQMVEEVGELAKALRKKIGYKVDVAKSEQYSEVSDEIADVFIFVLSMCNSLGINLTEALIHKEAENINRTWQK